MSKIAKYYIAVLLIFIFFPVPADARIEYTVIPRLSIDGMYNDNYYNREGNRDNNERDKKDGYFMTVSPGIFLLLLTKDTTLDIDYTLNSRGYFVEDEKDRYEYFLQRGSGIFRTNISKDISILLRDEIIKDESLTLINDALVRREQRLEFLRNISAGDLIFRYGEGREISAGYILTILDYFDNIVDDSKRHDFKGGILHSFDIRNNVDIRYRHSLVDYRSLNDPGQAGRDDLYEDEIRGKYTRHFTPQFSFGIGYGYMEAHYDELLGRLPIDYHVHDAAIEAVYIINKYLTSDGRVGLFLRDVYGRERMANTDEDSWEKGLIYRAGMAYIYPTVTSPIFTAMAAYEGNYGANYANPERLEYYRYWRASGNIAYYIMGGMLGFRGRGYYMVNTYPDSPDSRKDRIWNAGGGMDYRIFNWLLFSLEYSHTMRNSNVPGFHYVENTYLARITISYRISTMERERERQELIERRQTGAGQMR